MFEQELPQSFYTLFGVVSFVLGCMVGSFLNVCVHRWPRGESVVSPRSRCPKCEQPIMWYDNIPLVSWLILGAKCRGCGQPISWQYPLVEAITGLLFLFVYLRFGFVLATPVYMALSAAMVVVTFVDLTDWTIPNEITIPGVPIGIALSLVGMVYPASGLRLDDPIMSIAGAALGFAVLYGLDKIALVLLGKRGMGFGDVKLMAMLGAFFGPAGVVLTLVIASFLGSIVGVALIINNRRKGDSEEGGTYLPFGPYIAAGGLVVMFHGQEIIDLYLGYLNVPGAIA